MKTRSKPVVVEAILPGNSIVKTIPAIPEQNGMESHEKLARDFLGKLFRREGYDYAQTEAAILYFSEEMVSLLTRVRLDEREACSGHHPMRTDASRCYECGNAWPCRTVQNIRKPGEEC